MKFEKIQKILADVNLTFRDIECERKNGKWVFSTSIDVIRKGNIINGWADYRYMGNHGYIEIGHLFNSGVSVNKVINELFETIKRNELNLRTIEEECKCYDTKIKWDDDKKRFVSFNKKLSK